MTCATLNNLWLITWDSTESIATRPLALQKDGTWYTYGIDLPKNVTEIFSNIGGIRTAYTYTPYGQESSTGNVTQPIRWSSEYNDTELGMVYYNYRHYNPLDGRWISRDYMEQSNLYIFPQVGIDYLGLDNKYGLPDAFWNWYHDCRKKDYIKKLPGERKQKSKNCPKDVFDPKNTDLPREDAMELYEEWLDIGSPRVRKGDKCNGRKGKPNRKKKFEDYSGWERVGDAALGTLAVLAAGAIVVATIAEDVGTGGAGVADDPASFAASGASAAWGWSLLSAAFAL